MAQDKLILRTTPSEFSAFPDINLGKVLTHENLDGNFVYLKGNTIHSGDIVDNVLVLLIGIIPWFMIFIK